MTANPFDYEAHIEARLKSVGKAIKRRTILYTHIRWMGEGTESDAGTEPHSAKLPALRAITDGIVELFAREAELSGIRRMAETARLVGVAVQSTQVGDSSADRDRQLEGR